MVASVFNVLSTSPSSELPSNERNDEIGNSIIRDISGNLDDSIIEDTNADGVAVEEDETEIQDQDQDNTDDYKDDLKSLSNLKKY